MSGLHAMAAWIQQETSARRPGLDQTGVVMRTASVLADSLGSPVVASGEKRTGAVV